jgi:hypothetical protein
MPGGDQLITYWNRYFGKELQYSLPAAGQPQFLLPTFVLWLLSVGKPRSLLRNICVPHTKIGMQYQSPHGERYAENPTEIKFDGGI